MLSLKGQENVKLNFDSYFLTPIFYFIFHILCLYILFMSVKYRVIWQQGVGVQAVNMGSIHNQYIWRTGKMLER